MRRSAYLCRIEDATKFVQYEKLIDDAELDFLEKFYPHIKPSSTVLLPKKTRGYYTELYFYLSRLGLTDQNGFNLYSPNRIYFTSKINETANNCNFQIGKFTTYQNEFCDILKEILNIRFDELIAGQNNFFRNKSACYYQYDWLHAFHSMITIHQIVTKYRPLPELIDLVEYEKFKNDIAIICETLNYILDRPDSNKLWLEWR